MPYEQSGAQVAIPDHLIIEAKLRYVSGSTSTSAREPILTNTLEPTPRP